MIHVLGYKFEGSLDYSNGESFAELCLHIPKESCLSEMDLDKIKKATVIEEISTHYGEELETVGKYSLFGWLRVEKDVFGGYRIVWQTNRLTDVDTMKAQIEQLQTENSALRKENSEKEEALMELAAIINELSVDKNGGE